MSLMMALAFMGIPFMCVRYASASLIATSTP
jgi:hypothetical protein